MRASFTKTFCTCAWTVSIRGRPRAGWLVPRTGLSALLSRMALSTSSTHDGNDRRASDRLRRSDEILLHLRECEPDMPLDTVQRNWARRPNGATSGTRVTASVVRSLLANRREL